MPRGTLLNVAAVFVFILLLCSALSAVGQFKVYRVTDGDMIKVLNIGTASTVRLVGIDALETFKRKIETDKPFSQKSTKYIAGVVLNKSVEIKRYGNDRYGRILADVFVDGKGLSEIDAKSTMEKRMA